MNIVILCKWNIVFSFVLLGSLNVFSRDSLFCSYMVLSNTSPSILKGNAI